MSKRVYQIDDATAYRKAGPTDLLEMLPVPGGNPIFLPKWIVEILVCGIVHNELIHISGPSGSCKSSLLESLYRVPRNFEMVCRGLGCKPLPFKLYPIEMVTFEAPGELYQRRALRDGSTFDEKSLLVAALEDASASAGKCYPAIWLREIGRVHSSSVQGGLLNLMTKGDIVLPQDRRIDGSRISWVADSNYQAESDATHTLVMLDDALKRRFTIQLTLDYLSAPEETLVLQHLAASASQAFSN
jgi:hypothetical protein